MGEVYSHLSEEERQVIQIEVGNGASIRGIGAMLGRSPSSISREIKRNTWFPSNESESYRPYRPKRLKAGPWTGRYYIAGPAQRKADRRRSKPRKPYRLSHDRLWAQVAEWLCVCSIESGPCERVDVFHVSGRFWSTSACGEKRTPARPAWTSFPS